jgi:flagellar hook protein FlgE
MVSALFSAIQGLRAFQKEAEIIADNVANVNNPSFTGRRASIHGDKSVNPRAVTEKPDLQETNVQELPGPRREESSRVDLAEEMVGLILVQRGHESNVKTLQTADAMLGQLMDIKA